MITTTIEFVRELLAAPAVDCRVGPDGLCGIERADRYLVGNLQVEPSIAKKTLADFDELQLPPGKEMTLEVIDMPEPMRGWLGHQYAGFVLAWYQDHLTDEETDEPPPVVIVFPN